MRFSLGRGTWCAFLMLAVAVAGCSPTADDSIGPHDGGDGDEVDGLVDGADADADADADAEADAHADGDALDGIRESSDPRCPESSYIWIANTAEGTLSKLCTINGVELARYYTSPQGENGDPSRTSVNMHGDMVVTNRDPTHGTEFLPSSVTKFGGELDDCVDRDHDGTIRTSNGPTSVLAWGADECMLWNTMLPDDSATESIGARATAWDGTEDMDTGSGGTVWIGAFDVNGVYQLDGETGTVLYGLTIAGSAPYGGAIDPDGNFWIIAWGCTDDCMLTRVNTTTRVWDQRTVPCGYGITVDADGYVWTAGKTSGGSCVNRYDPRADGNLTYNGSGSGPDYFYRGIAVDNAGSVWAANTLGTVVQVRQSDVTLVREFPVGPAPLVGVAIDYHDNVWTVSQGGNEAEKINPVTYAVERFPVGEGPYTYSDMTGYQLRSVVIIF